MDIFLLYLFTRLDGLVTLLIVAIVLCVIGSIASVIYVSETRDEKRKEGWKAFKRFIVCAVVTALVTVLVPTQKDAALILAGYGVLQVAKSDTAQRLAGKSVQVIEQALDGYLKSTAKEGGK